MNIEKLKEEDILEIINWKYEDEYSIYNLPKYDIAKEKNIAIINPNRNNEFRIIKEDNKIIGWFRFLKDKGNYLGLGMNPKLCGKGNGKQFLNKIIEYLNEDYIILEVRKFNVRAIKCYESCGFKKIDEYDKEISNDKIRFIKMKYKKIRK